MAKKQPKPTSPQKSIPVTCRGADSIPVEALEEFQGSLKELTEQNFNRLRESILQFGFSAPCFVWKDGESYKILDAHQRLRVLRALLKEGYTLEGGRVPVDYIEAKDEQEAKAKVLAFISQYGAVTAESLYEFVTNAALDFQRLPKLFDIPDMDMDSFVRAFAPESPTSFPTYDEHIPTEHRCPKCGYEWSGGAPK